MEKKSDLRDLLKHEIYDLYSAEEQIIKALPAMIEKANNGQLKAALQQHLLVTENQLERLTQVQGFLEDRSEPQANEKKGLLARLFKRNYVCKGMQGLIEEGEKVMGEEMSPEVLDAAIIACAQKIEHYEICGYGTAKAFAKELNLMGVTQLLEETLDEEYEADDLLTKLAVERLNQKAEAAGKSSYISPSETFSQTNSVFQAREAMQERPKVREMESEMVSDQTSTASIKKQAAAKTKAPKGEAERMENQRETSSVRRATANSSNSKRAKSSNNRKTTDGRTSKTKGGR
jgi:ferritin-like metal-binding protein YciE